MRIAAILLTLVLALPAFAADTTTPTLGLVKPEAPDGSWGDKLNDNSDKIDTWVGKPKLPGSFALPASCTAEREVHVKVGVIPGGQQVYLCNATGDGWNLIGDGGSGGGGGGTGDIEKVFGCATGDCSTLAAEAGDSLDMALADSSKPATASTTLPATCAERQWHQDTDSGGSETYICVATDIWLKIVVTTDLTFANLSGLAGPNQLSSAVNTQTGTSYVYLDTDRGKLVSHCNGSAIAGTLAPFGTSSNAWITDVQNRCAGTLTITMSSGTIDGAASVALAQNSGLTIWCDGTSCSTQRGVSGSGSGTVNSGVQNKLAFYPSNGTIVDDAPVEVNATTGAPTFGDCATNCLTQDPAAVTGQKTASWPNATGTVVLNDNTATLTEKTIDAEGSGNVITIPAYWDFDLVGVTAGTVGHAWNDDPLSTACTPTAVTGTNRTTGVCTFPDSDGDIGRQITRYLPDGFTGSFDAVIWWKTTGTGNARFQFQTKCYADDEADDAAFNTASIVTAAAGTSGRPNKQTITGITTTGCAAGEIMRIRFFRNRTEASDTLTAALDVEKVIFKLRAAH